LLANDFSKWGDKFLANLMGTKSFDLKVVRKLPAQSAASSLH
jgi:hypothetical protein